MKMYPMPIDFVQKGTILSLVVLLTCALPNLAKMGKFGKKAPMPAGLWIDGAEEKPSVRFPLEGR